MMIVKKLPKNVKKSPLWNIVSEYIRRRDKGICFTCNAINDWKECHAGHFKHRNLATYFLEKNLHCQCVRCNFFLSGNMGVYRDKMVKLYGEQFVFLLEKPQKPKPMTLLEYNILLAEYKQKLKEL